MTRHDEKARSFGLDPGRYDRSRPGYSNAMVDLLLQDRPREVLDIGCGTGISARPFQRAGCLVRGVEHDSRMASVARERGLAVDVSRFEDWQPEADAKFDLAISGQAWHWIDPVAGPEMAADALRPGGRLAIFWVSYQHTIPVREAFERAYRNRADLLLTESFAVGNQLDLNASAPQHFAAALAANGSFTPASVHEFPGHRTYSVEEWIDELPTHSDHRLLEPAILEDLLAALADELGGLGTTFTVDLTTHLVTSTTTG